MVLYMKTEGVIWIKIQTSVLKESLHKAMIFVLITRLIVSQNKDAHMHNYMPY